MGWPTFLGRKVATTVVVLALLGVILALFQLSFQRSGSSWGFTKTAALRSSPLDDFAAVSCGNHRANSCSECLPQGRRSGGSGREGCGGECVWCNSTGIVQCLHRYSLEAKACMIERSFSGCNVGAVSQALEGRKWQVFLERPFDFMFQGIWAQEQNCRALACWLRQVSAGHFKSSYDVHTEMFMSQSNIGNIDPRKQQLPILSFLATQDPSVVLNIWIRGAAKPPAWLSSLLNSVQYGSRLRLRHFDLQSLLEELALSDDEKSLLSRALLVDGGIGIEASRSDIQRYIVLFVHGGIWFDTDTVFLSDVRPLAEVDFVTITQKDFLNNAIVGTSMKGSFFMQETLKDCARLFKESPNHENYFRYGPSLFGSVRSDFSRPMPFRVLPGCLVDSSWTGGFRGDPGWDGIFRNNATEENLAFLVDRTSGPFSFHWHGRWDMNITEGSFAAIAHEALLEELGLKL